MRGMSLILKTVKFVMNRWRVIGIFFFSVIQVFQSWQTAGLWPQIQDREQIMNSVAEVVLDICLREVEAVVNRFMVIVWGTVA
jgi:hypothetical protein